MERERKKPVALDTAMQNLYAESWKKVLAEKIAEDEKSEQRNDRILIDIIIGKMILGENQ